MIERRTVRQHSKSLSVGCDFESTVFDRMIQNNIQLLLVRFMSVTAKLYNRL